MAGWKPPLKCALVGLLRRRIGGFYRFVGRSIAAGTSALQIGVNN